MKHLEINANTRGSETYGLNHLPGIHALRGVAAIMVLCFHLHYVGKISLPVAWEFIASRGGMGVELFFVLSAFSLLFSNNNIEMGDKKWLFSYLIKRFFRIAPLFYFMIIVQSLINIYIFGAGFNFEKLFLNLMLVFNLLPKEAEGIVWASWSIGVEVIFYIIFPLLIVLVKSLRISVILWMIGSFLSFLYRRNLELDAGIPSGYLHYAFMSQFGIFCAGLLGCRLYLSLREANEILKKKILYLLIIFTFFLAGFLLSDASIFLVISGRPDVQLWGLVFSCISIILAMKFQNITSSKVFMYLGDRSYSIYLTHAVIIYFISPFLLTAYQYAYPLIGGYAFSLCVLITLLPVLIISELTYRVIELRGINFAKNISTTLNN